MSWPLEKTFLTLNFHVSSWFNTKKLTVHPAKSKFIIFIQDINRLIISSNVNIFINNAPITHEQGDQFHGIIIHKSLAWKPHITAIYDKISKVIGILSNSRHYLTSNTLKSSYNSLFLLFINYCNLIWVSTYASHLDPLHFHYRRKQSV